MTELRIAKDLALPLDAVSRATAIVGQRGTGKSSTAVVFVEEAAAAGAQFAVIDPTGAWFGLTSNAAGNGPGLECVLMGGEAGDVALPAESGALVARMVVEEGYSVVLNLDPMGSWGKRQRFVAEFCEELYERNRTALSLVVDEAHRFTPQVLRDKGGYAARCLGALTDVVTLGRRKGLGAVLISQRPAKIAKDVFEQAEIMIAHRLMGPNDRKQIAGWIDEIGAEGAESLSRLPKLEEQTALVYAPTVRPAINAQVVKVRSKRTFDSSATPELGGKVVLPKKRSEIDLSALQERMAETIERVKQEDPKELQRRLRALEKQLRERPEPELERVEVPVLDDEVRHELRDVVGQVSGMVEQLTEIARTIDARLGKAAPTRDLVQASVRPRAAPLVPTRPPPSRPRTAQEEPGEAPELKAGARRMLETLCRISPVRVSKAQLATLVGMKVTGGTYQTYFSKLKREGLIEEGGDRLLEPTDAGFAYLGDSRPAPLTQEEVVETWRGALKKGARLMLDVLRR